MKFLKILILVVVLLVVTIFLFIQINSRDLPTVNDADLILAPVPVLLQTDNAYFAFEELRAQEGVDEWALTNAFIAASQKTGYQCPTLVNNHVFDAESCSLNNIRDLAELTAERATATLSFGETADAVESALSIVRMAHLLAVSEGPIIEELVAMRLYDLGLEALTLISESPQLSSEDRAKIVDVLETTKPNRTNLFNAYRSEYMQRKDAIHKISTGDAQSLPGYDRDSAPSNYALHPNRTTDELAELFRLQITGADEEGLEKVKELTTFSPFTIIKPNGIGKVFLSVTVGSMTGASDKYTDLETKYEDLLESL